MLRRPAIQITAITAVQRGHRRLECLPLCTTDATPTMRSNAVAGIGQPPLVYN